MKGRHIVTGATILGIAAGSAGELPGIFEKPFLGCFIGFTESRDFQFALGMDGASELFFMKDRDVRLTTNGTTLKIYYVLEEKEEGKEGWTNRRMQEDGFETPHEATAEPELGKPFTFTATYTGDTKVEITHVFKDDAVEISTKIVERESANEMRIGVRVVVGDLYRHLDNDLDERDLRDKIEDSKIEVWPVDSKSSSGERIDLHEIDVNLQEKFPKGAAKFALESVRFAEHEFSVATADERFGTIEFRQTRALHHGFSLYWWPDPARSTEKDCRMILEVD